MVLASFRRQAEALIAIVTEGDELLANTRSPGRTVSIATVPSGVSTSVPATKLNIGHASSSLGQIQLDLGNEARAKDELVRAYMGGGPELFGDEDPKYFAFLRRFMRDI